MCVVIFFSIFFQSWEQKKYGEAKKNHYKPLPIKILHTIPVSKNLKCFAIFENIKEISFIILRKNYYLLFSLLNFKKKRTTSKKGLWWQVLLPYPTIWAIMNGFFSISIYFVLDGKIVWIYLFIKNCHCDFMDK